MDDAVAMQLALAQAYSVEGRTSPRPPVGAVVVRDGHIVGRGATAPPYGPHAEVKALEQAGEAARGSVLYVTLEPCCIQVHTPPCTAAIIASGVSRVVIAAHDPHPRVYTKGISRLRDAGIDVTLLEDGQERREAEEIIRPFATYIIQSRPYVTAKWAMTLDGKLATYTHDARWITGPDARSWVHDLRDRVDAILVGAGTTRADNPRLTVRLDGEQARAPRSRSPLRVVLSTSGQLPAHLALLQPELASGTCIIVGDACSHETRQRLSEHGADVLPIQLDSSGQLDLQAALQVLGQRGIMHVLIEGGARLLGSAFDQHCIDHVAAFVAPKLIGGSGAPSPVAGKGLALVDHAACLRNARMTLFAADVLIEGDVSYEDCNDKRG